MHVTYFVYVVVFALAIETPENIFCKFLAERVLSSLTQELTPCISFNSAGVSCTALHTMSSPYKDMDVL